MVSNLASVLGGTINDKNNMKSSMVRKDSISTWFVLPRNTLKVRVKEATVKTQDITGTDVLVWGHPTYGIWNDGLWGTAFANDYTSNNNYFDTQITVAGAQQLQQFLANGTAAFPTHVMWGNGTVPFSRSSTELSGLIGSKLIGTSMVGTSLNFSSEVFSTDVSLVSDDSLLNLNLLTNPTPTVYDLSDASNDGEFKINASAYYPFNGDANDESINSNDGVVTGASLTTDRFGSTNNAYLFDSNSENINISLGNVSGAFTYSTWIKVYSYSAYGAVSGNNGLIGSLSDFNEGRISFQGTNDDVIGVRTSTSGNVLFNLLESCPTNEYYMLTIIRDASNEVNIYKNGVSIATAQTISGDINFEILFDNPTNSSWRGFNGVGDSVLLLTDTALSADEVTNLYNTTSVHKLDKPVVTKTDVNGDSITGYEAFNSYIDVDSTGIDLSNTFSIYLEFMPYDFISTRYALQLKDTSGHRLRFFQDTDGLFEYDFYPGEIGNLKTTINNNQVNKVLLSYDGTSMNIYNNNVLIDSAVVSNIIGTVSEVNYFAGTGCCFMNGVVSKPVIWDKVLTEKERTDLFDNGGGRSITQIGFYNETDNVLHYYTDLQDELIMDGDSNYKFDFGVTFETDGGSRNVWTNDGTAFMAETYGGTANSNPDFYGFGTGTAAVDVTSTSLDGEFLRNEVTGFSYSDYLISTLYTSVGVNDGVGTAISRGGLWSGGTADSSAVLLTEDKFSTINKTALFSIDLEYKNLIN